MWFKKKKETTPEPKSERIPFKLKLLWVDGTPETVEGIILIEPIPAVVPLLKIIFEDKHQRLLNVCQLKSWESEGAAPVDTTGYS